MARGDDRKNAAGVGERGFHVAGAGPELIAKVASPRLRVGFRIIEQAAPHAMTVYILLPIPAGPQRSVGIGAAVARDARSAATLEGEGLADLNAVTTTEAEGAGVGGSGQRI